MRQLFRSPVQLRITHFFLFKYHGHGIRRQPGLPAKKVDDRNAFRKVSGSIIKGKQ